MKRNHAKYTPVTMAVIVEAWAPVLCMEATKIEMHIHIFFHSHIT